MSRDATIALAPSATSTSRPRSQVRRLIQWTYRKIPEPLRRVSYASLRLLAICYRRTLVRHVTVVGITGSSGKTTTKELLATLLGPERCTASPASWNNRNGILWSILLMRPWRKLHVQEIAVGQSSSPIDPSLAVLRCRIAIVTSIGSDHISMFGSLDGIAAEKGKLVASLPEDGIAFLNADDPRVLAMASYCQGRVVTFGTSATASVRAVDVQSQWPHPLSFNVAIDENLVAIRTGLFGQFFLPAVLGAWSAAVTAGIPMERAVERLASFAAEKYRMQPRSDGRGVNYLIDCAKAPAWHFPLLFKFLQDAQAERKIVVIGTISDFKQKARREYTRIARAALEAVNIVVFVGPYAPRSEDAKKHQRGEHLHIFVNFAEAGRFLKSIIRSQDLVVFKGQARIDDFETLFGQLRTEGTGPHTTNIDEATMEIAPSERTILIVGLGNRRAELRDTLHNVGWMAVEALAGEYGLQWTAVDGGWLTEPLDSTRRIRFVRLDASMNASGLALSRICVGSGAKPADLVLVHDDIALPRGQVRVRLRGGDGGHKGVRSIVTTLGTDHIARVKLGVGAPPAGDDAAGYVVRPLPTEERAAVAEAAAAAGRIAVETASQLLDDPERTTSHLALGRPPEQSRSMPAIEAH